MQSARRSAIPSRCSIAASSNIPASEVIRPPSKVKCTGLPATGGKPGRIPVPSSMAGANSVGFNLSGVATESYMEPIVYVAPASPLRQPDELSRLGTVMGPAPNGWVGGLICVSAIYLPSFLLLVGVLPFWDALRRRTAIRSALAGVNAAVVGLLLAALYTPVWTSAIFAPADFAIGIVAFLLLTLWAVPPWLVVIL